MSVLVQKCTRKQRWISVPTGSHKRKPQQGSQHVLVVELELSWALCYMVRSLAVKW